MSTLAQILPTGDHAALTRWLADPHACTTHTTDWCWGGEASIAVGRDLCAALARTDDHWSPAHITSALVRRMIKKERLENGLVAMFGAVLAYVAHTPGTLATHDGLNLLASLDFLEDGRDYGMEGFPIFSPLYDAIAHTVPLEQALAYVQGRITRHQGYMGQIFALLAIYGVPAWRHIHPLAAYAVDKGRFYYLSPQETALSERLARGGGHEMLPLFSLFDRHRLRDYAPHAIQYHLVGHLERHAIRHDMAAPSS